MIVLDEQLLGRGIEQDIAHWYRGKVQFIVDMRPHSVIKDDAIPVLLRQQSQATFVTINERDFWQRVPGDPRYCVVCFALPDTRTHEIPSSLRLLFCHPTLHTKAQRMMLQHSQKQSQGNLPENISSKHRSSCNG